MYSSVDCFSPSANEVKSYYAVLWKLHSPADAFEVVGLNDNFHSRKTLNIMESRDEGNRETKGIESLLLIFSTHAMKLLKLSSRRIGIRDGGKRLNCEYLFPSLIHPFLDCFLHTRLAAPLWSRPRLEICDVKNFLNFDIAFTFCVPMIKLLADCKIRKKIFTTTQLICLGTLPVWQARGLLSKLLRLSQINYFEIWKNISCLNKISVCKIQVVYSLHNRYMPHTLLKRAEIRKWGSDQESAAKGIKVK